MKRECLGALKTSAATVKPMRSTLKYPLREKACRPLKVTARYNVLPVLLVDMMRRCVDIFILYTNAGHWKASMWTILYGYAPWAAKTAESL